MGKGAGLEGVLLASGPTMPVPLKKTRGQACRTICVKTSCRAAIPGGGEWPEQALQDDLVSNATEVAGGGWVGEVFWCQSFDLKFSLSIVHVYSQFN